VAEVKAPVAPSVENRANQAHEQIDKLLGCLRAMRQKLCPFPVAVQEQAMVVDKSSLTPLPERMLDICQQLSNCHDELQEISSILF